MYEYSSVKFQYILFHITVLANVCLVLTKWISKRNKITFTFVPASLVDIFAVSK
jgi:hypothetical protein